MYDDESDFFFSSWIQNISFSTRQNELVFSRTVKLVDSAPCNTRRMGICQVKVGCGGVCSGISHLITKRTEGVKDGEGESSQLEQVSRFGWGEIVLVWSTKKKIEESCVGVYCGQWVSAVGRSGGALWHCCSASRHPEVLWELTGTKHRRRKAPHLATTVISGCRQRKFCNCRMRREPFEEN